MKSKTENHSFALWIAFRYLFSKKSHNAVNIITIISAAGVCIGTLALIIVLSVFNGFESIVEKMFSTFDPDIKITLTNNNRFELSQSQKDKIYSVKGIENISIVVEGMALVQYQDRKVPITLMGVSENFNLTNSIDSILIDGKYFTERFDTQYALLGVGVATQLSVNAHSIYPLTIYAPKREEKINMLRPETSLISEQVRVSGVFVVNQPEYDDNFLLVSKKLASSMFQLDSEQINSLHIKLKKEYNSDKIQKELKSILGEKFQVLNRYEQQKEYFKIAKIEKWITYLILSFILIIAIMNIIGSLSLLIIEKKTDISTLKSLGATDALVKRIFLYEGWLISTLGAIIGMILGVIIILIQQYFGILKLGANYVVDYYPVLLSTTDVIVTLFTVIVIGFLAVTYPVSYIVQKKD